MNSLTFLSRQFDVLASTKTPLSTPTSEHIPNVRYSGSSSQHTPIKRVQTWSTKSFLFSQSPHATYPTPQPSPRRSASSPAHLLDLSVSSPHIPSSPSTAAGGISIPVPAPAPEIITAHTRSRRSSFQAAFERIFFLQVFVLLWEVLYAGWTSLTARAPMPVRRQSTPSDDGSVSSDEDQKERLLRPTLAPTIPSVIYADPSATLDYIPPTTSHPRMFSPLTPRRDVSSSRSSTPASTGAKTLRGVAVPKTLVLDLDETLIHSTSRPMQMRSSWNLRSLFSFGKRNKGTGHTVEVILGGERRLYHVYKRPFVDFFLRTVSGWYTLVIFTASMQEYADPVIDWLDAGRGILVQRLFRDSCTQLPNGSYTKDLAVVESDLSRVCLLDNSPISYKINEANGIPIEGWTHDPSDEALLDLLPILDSLRFTSDVRRVLGIRGFS